MCRVAAQMLLGRADVVPGRSTELDVLGLDVELRQPAPDELGPELELELELGPEAVRKLAAANRGVQPVQPASLLDVARMPAYLVDTKLGRDHFAKQ